jgi:hypothetical protein
MACGRKSTAGQWMCGGKNGEDCGNYTALLQNIFLAEKKAMVLPVSSFT